MYMINIVFFFQWPIHPFIHLPLSSHLFVYILIIILKYIFCLQALITHIISILMYNFIYNCLMLLFYYYCNTTHLYTESQTYD